MGGGAGIRPRHRANLWPEQSDAPHRSGQRNPSSGGPGHVASRRWSRRLLRDVWNANVFHRATRLDRHHALREFKPRGDHAPRERMPVVAVPLTLLNQGRQQKCLRRWLGRTGLPLSGFQRLPRPLLRTRSNTGLVCSLAVPGLPDRPFRLERRGPFRRTPLRRAGRARFRISPTTGAGLARCRNISPLSRLPLRCGDHEFRRANAVTTRPRQLRRIGHAAAMIPALGGGQTPARMILAGKRLAAIFLTNHRDGDGDRNHGRADTQEHRQADQPRDPPASN